jgi:hypothetical protein
MHIIDIIQCIQLLVLSFIGTGDVVGFLDTGL